ncbi:MAG: SDR family oxidoreductase [Raineya sp.]
MELDGKVFILTGAASGIGKELFKILSKKPIKIAAIDLSFPENFLDNSASAQIVLLNYDLSQPNAIDELFEKTLNLWGKIDVFVANAGFAYYEKIEEANWERIEKIYQVNTFSPIYSLLKMKELNKGRDFYVCITASAMAKMGLAGYALYGATKAALDRFADAYWQENARKPNHLGLVYPVATRTNFFKQAGKNAPIYFPNQTAEKVAQSIYKGILKRKKKIYPSLLFTISYFFGFLQECLNKPYQWYAQSLFKKK